MIADVTWFYRWGPRDALSLTVAELQRWCEHAVRIAEAQAGRGHGE